MRFRLVDNILDRDADRIRAIKHVTAAEEYLADHFPSFPVLPGVMMLEGFVEAARALLVDRTNDRLVLGEVRALKYGNMIRPGETLEIEVELVKSLEHGAFQCRGTGRRRRPGDESGTPAETAVAGRFTMRPLRPN